MGPRKPKGTKETAEENGAVVAADEVEAASPTFPKEPAPSIPSQKSKPSQAAGTIDWGFGSAENIQSKDVVAMQERTLTFFVTLIVFIFSAVFIYAGDGLREAGMAFFGAGVSHWFKNKK